MTKITYADEVWNVTAGCTKCSPGCLNCYAERMAKRQVAMGCARGGDNTATWIAYSDAINPKTEKWSGKIALRPDQLDKPLHWKKPRRIFVNSMSDLFHKDVPFDYQYKVFGNMKKCPQHTFLVFTKRIDEMCAFLNEYYDSPKYDEWPLHHRHIQLILSLSTQKEADEKIPILLQIPAAVRGLSLEPLLELIDFGNRSLITDKYRTTFSMLKALGWIVVGCESGPKRRPCKIEWVRSIVQQCQAAGVPVYVKQLSINGKVSRKMLEWPEDLRIQQYP